MRVFSPRALHILMATMKPRPMTQARLAARIARKHPSLSKCSRQLVKAWLDNTPPNANYLAAISEELGVTMEDLFEDVPDDLVTTIGRSLCPMHHRLNRR